MFLDDLYYDKEAVEILTVSPVVYSFPPPTEREDLLCGSECQPLNCT